LIERIIQVVLVRDQSTADDINKYIDLGLVLTIQEVSFSFLVMNNYHNLLQAKGLEFDTVILLNFWKDSPARREWEVIYQFMKEKNIKDLPEIVNFTGKHQVLCTELKLLYVGMTRAKENLYIFDDLEEVRYS
jgi:DNA helicase IV